MTPDLTLFVPAERLPETLDELHRLTASMPEPIALEATPLHQLFGPALLSQLMLMSLHRQGDVAIYHCKHAATRRSLYVGDDLRFWNYDPATGSFHHLPSWNALSWALSGTEEAGLFPGDDVAAWRARQQAEALARGQRVVVCEAGQGIVNDSGHP